jgi:hypothetical protein
VYDQLSMPVWMCHGVRGDFTNYRKAERFVLRPNWRIAVFPTGALPHFEVLAQVAGTWDAFRRELAPDGG